MAFNSLNSENNKYVDKEKPETVFKIYLVERKLIYIQLVTRMDISMATNLLECHIKTTYSSNFFFLL